MIKQLNVLDLNGKSITIRLKSKYHREIRNLIINNGGFYKLEKKYKLNYIRIWQAIKINSIPLYILNILKNHFKIENIGEKIDSLKSYHGRKWIKNPQLIIRVSPDLLEILGHCMGDGYLTLKKGNTSNYTNTSKKLVGEFKRLCKNVFGEIELTTCLDKRFDAETVILPRIFATILTQFFPEALNKKLSPSIFNLSKDKITSLIRAFADDESCVTTSEINYTQKDEALLEDIRQLHILLGFKEENLTPVKKRGGIHYFAIKGEGLKYFHENVGFKHPCKKKALEVEIKRKNNKRVIWTRDLVKKEITFALDSPKTIQELSCIIGVQPSIIRKHIKQLEKRGYVKIAAYGKYNVPVWVKVKEYTLINDRRKDTIMDFLRDTQVSTLEISKKIYLGKDRTLSYLSELKKENKINCKVKGKTYLWYLE